MLCDFHLRVISRVSNHLVIQFFSFRVFEFNLRPKKKIVHSVIFSVSFLFCFVCVLTFWRPCDTRISCLVHYYLLSFSPSSQKTFFEKEESKKPQDPKSLPNPERREKKKTVNRDRQTESA